MASSNIPDPPINTFTHPWASKIPPPPSPTFSRSTKDINYLYPSTPSQSVSNQTHVSTTLATRLFSKKHHSNVVFSPVSIHAVLSLAAAGSKGPTLDQFLAFLKTSSTDDLNSLYSQLVSSVLADGSLTGGPRLCFVNGVWVDKTYALKPSFKQIGDTVYKAACKQVDFQTSAAEVVNQVNLWVEKQTNDLIKQVLPKSAINNLTRLMFANVVYFKGAWNQKFAKSLTKEYEFHLLDGNKVRVPFMTNNKSQFVREYDGFKVLGLPYIQGQEKRLFTMYVFLPDAKDGLQSLVEKIGSTSDFLDRDLPRDKVQVRRFLLPKFKISFEFIATDLLMELGLVLPFTNDCDLSEMADSSAGESLYVSSIIHKAVVEVSEEGTVASAVTIAAVFPGGPSHVKPRVVDFVADHPFLFVIREDRSGVVLFMGQVIEPHVG
ncbi:serpin-ZX-like [Bidens hawaiensis]|uniref:serpin-ZX-like n=1 Tax=Bidens hawaiensis TaxID=980011 RepID=UPI004049F877